jgi:hypothetical protein
MPANRVNAQLRLAGDGTIDFIYGATVTASSAVVGVSPGETGIFSPVDVSAAAAAAAIPGGSGAVGERFSNTRDFDFAGLTQKFYQTHGDDFDQIVIFTNTKTTRQGTFAAEFTVANEVAGIGIDVYDSRPMFLVTGVTSGQSAEDAPGSASDSRDAKGRTCRGRRRRQRGAASRRGERTKAVPAGVHLRGLGGA